MMNFLTKWGAVAIGLVVLATIVMQFSASVSGISNWFGDNYLPKKYMIIEKYPIRIIMYGQFDNYEWIDNDSDINNSIHKEHRRTNNIENLLRTMDKLHYEKGTFSDYNIMIDVDSDFNSRQIRSSDRRITTGSSPDK